jgi:XTP/dITP diphosphohydrolase
MTSDYPKLAALVDTMAVLRGPGGCPWDAEQTHESLVGYLLEEVFELIEALEAGSRPDMTEELGDVLYQVLFHADLAAAHPTEPFTIEDVAAVVDKKMRERHPHVFADGDAHTVDEVIKRWDEIKAEQKDHRESALDGIPQRLSALARAQSVIKRAGDKLPTDASASTHPVDAELLRAEPLTAEPMTAEPITTEQELGRALFALVLQAKAQGLDAERALRTHVRAVEDRVRAGEAQQK